MKKLIIFLSAFLLIFLPKTAFSQTKTTQPYVVESFDSQIIVNQDTSLSITETITVRFNVPKHGIFRIIPDIYSAKGKTIKAKITSLTVTDEKSTNIRFSPSRLNKSLKIQIGDPDITITGLKTYIIRYKISDVLLSYKDHEEVYWNVTGSEWDTTLNKVTATVISPLAKMTKVECYSGQTGLKGNDCQANLADNRADFSANKPYSWGYDFTIVAGLDKQNQLLFPGPIQKLYNFITDNWGYLASLLPLLIVFLVWFTKGRDLKYLSDNVYVKPENQETRTVGLFEREHLPLTYSPINGLTPSQVGTIIDEKVDTKDVVAEIMELARLGFIGIQRTEKKKLLGKATDYLFTNKNKDASGLKEYQKYLLDHLFDNPLQDIDLSSFIENNLDNTGKTIVRKAYTEKIQTTSLSQLKDHFYSHLIVFKKKLYENLDKEENIFDGKPEKARTEWGCLSVLFLGVGFLGTIAFVATTANSGPQILLFLTIIPIIVLIKNMPRRTAWGHSLYRQAVGLKFYINEGKWREEISEKNLFLEEILPLAICLGVVDKLAHDMEVLGIAPPSYLNGFTANRFASDFNHFSSSTASNLVSSPSRSWSGSSNWSGGSGFSGGGGFSSGGSSGGGFGGGGGGSW